MEKEKSKNRSDLLNAGRKKLQQFRKKKDSKGSKNGKTSNISDESEQLVTDGNLSTDAESKSKETVKFKSPCEVLVSHSNSMENVVAPDIDITAISPLSLPVPSETDVGSIYSEEFPLHHLDVIGSDAAINNSQFTKDTVDGMCADEDAQVTDVLVSHSNLVENLVVPNIDIAAIFSPLSVPVPPEKDVGSIYSEELPPHHLDIIVSGAAFNSHATEGMPVQSQILVSVDLINPDSISSSDVVADTVDGMCADGDAQVTDVGTLQNAGYFTSKQFDSTGKIEVIEDGNLPVLECSENSLTYVVSANAGAINNSHGFSFSALTNEGNDRAMVQDHTISVLNEDNDRAFLNDHASSIDEVVDQQSENSVPNSSTGERFQNLLDSKTGAILADRDGMSDNELCESTNIPGKCFVASAVDLSSNGLLQLKKVHSGLDEHDFRSLLKSRKSDSTLVVNSCSFMVSEYAYDVLQNIKDRLFLTSITKDLLYLHFFEQSERQLELESQNYQLMDRISVLSTSLNEVQEENISLSEKLAHCRSETQIVTGGKEELQNQFDIARSEIEAFSKSSDELKVKYEHSQREMLNLSAELANCNGFVTNLQRENEKLYDDLSLVTQGRMKVVEEKESLVNENERLLVELAEYKNVIASLQRENSSFSENYNLIIKENIKMDESMRHFIDENEKLLKEIVDYRGLVNCLELEKANLIDKLSLVTEERNKSVWDMENSIHEKQRLSLELLIYIEFLSMEHADRRRLELKLEEVNLYVKQLTNETSIPHRSLDIYEPKGNLETRKMHVSSQDKNASDPFKCFDEACLCQSQMICGGYTQQLSTKPNSDIFSPLLEKPLSDSCARESHHLDVFDNFIGLVVLKEHLGKAEMITRKLDMAIEQIHSHSFSPSRPGGKMAAPGISKLIQTFESKVHLDSFETHELNFTKDQSLGDPFLLAKEQIEILKAILMELYSDAQDAEALFKEGRNYKLLTSCTYNDLKDRHDVLKDHSNNLEARNIELEVLYETLKQHLCHIESKNAELVVSYETIKKKYASLKTDNSLLGMELNNYHSRVSELQSQLHEVLKNSDEMAASIYFQLEKLQKETFDRASLLEKNWKFSVSQFSGAIGKLDAFVYGLSGTKTKTREGLDISVSAVTSVDATISMIKNLQEKLETTCTDCELMHCSYRELNERYSHLHGENELAICLLQKIHDDLWKLVIDSGEFVEACENNIKNKELLDPLNPINYETLTGKLGDFLSKNKLLQSVNNDLNSEVINLKVDLEKLKQRSLDINIINKLINDIECALNLDKKNIISNEQSVENLLSLVFILVQKYKDASVQVQLSRQELEGKFIESNEMEGKIHELYSSHLHHEIETLILKESLCQAEEALFAVHSDLQQKATDLEQSEQRVSSVKEKLSIAVMKGKGLILQRDNLKQSLAELTKEMDKCSEELKLKDGKIYDAELNLKTYSEAGERVEALESELSYIRNSATALRESFLHRDSVIQRIEEVLEDIEFPENFHPQNLTEKVNWLARSVAGKSLSLINTDEKNSVEGASYPEGDFVITDGWKENVQQPSMNMSDDVKRNFEELERKFYGLAEQNEMLERSLMERNNLVQRCEEVLDRINMPSQLQSMEPDDRIEWLRSSFSEAHHNTDLLQHKIDYFETHCGSLTADLDESRRCVSNLEAALEEVIQEKEHISERMENLISDTEMISERSASFERENAVLQNELSSLQKNLVERNQNVNQINIFNREIKRLQDLIIDVLQDTATEDEPFEGMGIEYLENLLRKLIGIYESQCSMKPAFKDAIYDQSLEKTDVFHVEPISIDALNVKEHEVAVLKIDLEEAIGNLICVKGEKDAYFEKYRSCVHEIEILNNKCQELQEQCNQEEKKTASVREKLTVAVRKGKSLVQERGNLKLNIEEMNEEIKQLKTQISDHQNASVDHERTIKELGTFSQRVEALESENLFLKKCLSETEEYLQKKENIISRVRNALQDIDFCDDVNISDPLDRVEQLGELYLNLKASADFSEHESRKSKRAAELLLAELNEVQERNDVLQEEMAKAAVEHLEISNERALAEAAKQEALYSVRSEERKILIAKFLPLKSCVNLLSQGVSDVSCLLADVISKHLELLHNLEAGMDSCLKPTAAIGLIDLSFLITPTENFSANSVKENILATEFSDSQIEDSFNSNELFSFFENHLRDSLGRIEAFRGNLYGHSDSVNEEAKKLSKIIGNLQSEMASRKKSVELMKSEINRLNSLQNQNDSDKKLMSRNIAILHETCMSSIFEIENRKQKLAGNNAPQDLALTEMNADDSVLMADRLLVAVKDFASLESDIVESRTKEMKITISNLQNELQEKNALNERTCLELVSQIEEAEAAAKKKTMDLRSAETRLHDLGEEKMLLLQRLEALQSSVNSLDNALAVKEQESDTLIQALEEEEVQIEGLMKRKEELEKAVDQKIIDLKSLEATHAKTAKKLGITMTKFNELHTFSADLLAEVENLQAQLQERDSEISFLRQEVTRCTNDVLAASRMNTQKASNEIFGFLASLDAIISRIWVHDAVPDGEKNVQDFKEMIQKQIMCIVSELEEKRVAVQKLEAERIKLEELKLASEIPSPEVNLRDFKQESSPNSEILEIESLMNKRATPIPSIISQVRSLRKVNNDQVAITIDDSPDTDIKLDDGDDDKVHGFKLLSTSRIVPRFTRPITDMIDGLWVSCDRALMRQPGLRMGIIIYWAVLHSLLAAFVV